MSTAIKPEPTTAPAQPAGVPVSTDQQRGSAIQRHLAGLRDKVEKGEGLGPLGATTTDQALGGVAQTPAAHAAEASAAETPVAEPVAESTEVTLGADGKWRNPDGSFAATPPAEAVEAVAGAESTETPVADTPAPIVVKLKGRGENDPDREIHVDDQETADLLRQNYNNGLRRAEFERQKATLEQREQGLREITTRLETAPESVTEYMDDATRVRLTRYLIAQHFDHPDVQSTLAAFGANPGELRVARAEMSAEALRYRQESDQRLVLARKAGEIQQAVRTLIPEGTDETIASQFFRDSIADLSQLANARGDLDPREVPELIAGRVRLYGFNTPAAAPANGATTILAAAPKGAAAESIAAKKVTVAKARVAAVQNAQATRTIAAKVAPSGAGAIPVTVQDGPPKGAGIKGALDWARKNWVKAG